MTKRANATAKLAKWEKPVLNAIDMDMSNVETGFAPGTDGAGGPFATSMS